MPLTHLSCTHCGFWHTWFDRQEPTTLNCVLCSDVRNALPPDGWDYADAGPGRPDGPDPLEGVHPRDLGLLVRAEVRPGRDGLADPPRRRQRRLRGGPVLPRRRPRPDRAAGRAPGARGVAPARLRGALAAPGAVRARAGHPPRGRPLHQGVPRDHRRRRRARGRPGPDAAPRRRPLRGAMRPLRRGRTGPSSSATRLKFDDFDADGRVHALSCHKGYHYQIPLSRGELRRYRRGLRAAAVRAGLHPVRVRPQRDQGRRPGPVRPPDRRHADDPGLPDGGPTPMDDLARGRRRLPPQPPRGAEPGPSPTAGSTAWACRWSPRASPSPTTTSSTASATGPRPRRPWSARSASCPRTPTARPPWPGPSGSRGRYRELVAPARPRGRLRPPDALPAGRLGLLARPAADLGRRPPPGRRASRSWSRSSSPRSAAGSSAGSTCSSRRSPTARGPGSRSSRRWPTGSWNCSSATATACRSGRSTGGSSSTSTRWPTRPRSALLDRYRGGRAAASCPSSPRPSSAWPTSTSSATTTSPATTCRSS